MQQALRLRRKKQSAEILAPPLNMTCQIGNARHPATLLHGLQHSGRRIGEGGLGAGAPAAEAEVVQMS